MEEHLVYAKYSHEGRGIGKSHNDTSKKTLERQNSEVEIVTLRDCQGSYSPRLTEFDDQILALFARKHDEPGYCGNLLDAGAELSLAYSKGYRGSY